MIKRKEEEIEQLLEEKKEHKSKMTSTKKIKVSDLKFSENFPHFQKGNFRKFLGFFLEIWKFLFFF